MNRFKLNKATLKSIRTTVGMDASRISDSDISVVDTCIERKTNKRLTPAMKLGGLSPRGSVYLMFNRVFTAKEIDRQLSRIK